jgi:hypothetical protein
MKARSAGLRVAGQRRLSCLFFPLRLYRLSTDTGVRNVDLHGNTQRE